MTPRDLITGAMKLIGVLAAGETASAEDASDNFTALNNLVDEWSLEHLLTPYKVREEFSLVSGTQSYTIGSSGTFNTSRPLGIEAATIEDQAQSPTVEYPPLEIINTKQWAEVTQKDATASIPQRLYMEDSYPLATIYLYPKPSASLKLVLYSWKPLTAFTGLSQSLSLAPGFARAYIYNLALAIAPTYGLEPSALVLRDAAKTIANIKRAQSKPVYMRADDAVMGRKPYNINTGE